MNLGLIGAPGAGKDVVAGFLIEEYGFKRLAFADNIKKNYYAYSGITEKEFKESRGTSKETEIRNGLWKYSDEMRNKYGNLHFIEPVVKEMSQSDSPVVVSDIRTIEELNAVEDSGARIILISRKSLSHEIPETRINSSRVKGYPVFNNNSDSLEEALLGFNEFYQGLVRARFK